MAIRQHTGIVAASLSLCFAASRCLTLYLASVAMIAAPLCFRTGAEETGTDKGLEPYDFYANTKYPGATLRPDLELYKVKQAGGGDPLAYERREVVWWPRKGVDIIEVKDIKRPWRNILNEPMKYGFTVFYNVTSEDPIV